MIWSRIKDRKMVKCLREQLNKLDEDTRRVLFGVAIIVFGLLGLVTYHAITDPGRSPRALAKRWCRLNEGKAGRDVDMEAVRRLSLYRLNIHHSRYCLKKREDLHLKVIDIAYNSKYSCTAMARGHLDDYTYAEIILGLRLTVDRGWRVESVGTDVKFYSD